MTRFTAKSHLSRGSRKNLKPNHALIQRLDKKARRLFFTEAFAVNFSLILIVIVMELNSYNPQDTLINETLFIMIIVITSITWFWSGFKYRHYYYELTDKQINIYSGKFNKRVQIIPYDMITGVNLNSTFFPRNLGLVRLWIETVEPIDSASRFGLIGEYLIGWLGPAHSEYHVVHIPGLSQDQAMKLKAELLSKAKNIATQATQRN